jgi:hypothetical protein
VPGGPGLLGAHARRGSSVSLVSVELEQSVLGVALAFAEEARPALLGLGKDCFEDAAHRLIWATVQAMLARGEPVDTVMVFERLRATGAAEKVGGLSYLNALAQSVLNARSVVRWVEALKEKEARRRLDAIGQELQREAAGPLDATALRLRVAALVERLARGADLGESPARVAFPVVPIADLAEGAAQAQAWWWQGYIPAGHVTLFNGHGGAGKSTVALMLLVAMATERAFLGQSTKRGRLLFFSAEDPAALVRLRLRRICTAWGVDPAALAQWLRVIDATELDAALFAEQRIAGVRHGATTPAYEALADFMRDEAIDVAVLDNASDLFDGDEIVRPMVRGFIRALAHLVRERGGAVVLLAHVDKSTSRAGKSASSESYSGSTAWNNSVRSRIVLLEKEPGVLELQHQKCNLGPKLAPVALTWPEGGLPGLPPLDAPADAAARPSAADSLRDLVALVLDYYGRGEWVSTALKSPANAAKLLANEARYPRHLKPTQVVQLLRDAQRAKFLETEAYQGADRKPRERWRVTEEGRAFVDGLPLFRLNGAEAA